MSNFKNKSQAGFAGIIEIALIALVIVIAGAAAVHVKQSQNNKKVVAAQQQKDKETQAALLKAHEAKKTAEAAKVATPVEVTASPTTPEPVKVTPTPAPTTKPPVVAKSNATAFTAANCTGEVTVYVSNKNGTTSSYHQAPNWEVVKTYTYGQEIHIYCQMGGVSPEYIFDNDAYIKSADVSPTRP